MNKMLLQTKLLALVGLLSSLSTSVLAQDGGVLQPVLPSDLQQCSNVTISWTGTPPVAGQDEQYAVRIINSETAGLELAAEVPLTWIGHFMEETSYSWRVGIPVGTNITLLITDQAGNRGYSAPAVVRNGSSRCMPEEYAPDYFLGDSPGTASTLSADGMLLATIIGSALLVFAVSFTT